MKWTRPKAKTIGPLQIRKAPKLFGLHPYSRGMAIFGWYVPYAPEWGWWELLLRVTRLRRRVLRVRTTWEFKAYVSPGGERCVLVRRPVSATCTVSLSLRSARRSPERTTEHVLES
jgi:hypothetical protein